MGFYLDIYNSTKAIEKKKLDKIMSLSEKAQNNNIPLTVEKAQYILDSSNSVLKDCGRIEFGDSVAFKITDCFLSSANVSKYDFEKVIEGLIEVFYLIKNEINEKLTDDEIIEAMQTVFEKGACGSTVHLAHWAEREIYSIHNGAETLNTNFNELFLKGEEATDE
ncbi:MAG: hypothetical protein IJ262_05720 [Clostridia bacterium]|nr:hypothetical protein [Clostridia bacterium]